jgi:hypothetical protein
MKKSEVGRGKVDVIKLRRPITFNSKKITKAIIEIDHINFGLNPKTKELNPNSRTNFTIRDIEKFIFLLDGEMLAPERYRETSSIFEIRIDCPVEGKFFGKEFLMIFETDYTKEEQIYTLTLYPIWKKGDQG